MSEDMLVDMFERNKKFTDLSRANSPRRDTPELYIAMLHEKGLISEKEFKKAIMEISSMRNSLALNAEVAEYIDELPYKWWGRGAWETDNEKAVEELIDVMHFLLVAFDDLGLGPKEIYEAYKKKNDYNFERFEKQIGWKEPQR